MAEPFDDSIAELSGNSSLHTGEGVIIDIGTGDGHFAYHCARRNPKKFYIGIDPNPRPLEKLSEKIFRKPAQGGLPNALFLQASIEDLPPELEGIADEVHVHFPWGSLLRAVATGDKVLLANLRRLCSSSGLLEVILALDAGRDRSEVTRLGLQPISIEYIDSVLVPNYRSAQFAITERGIFSPSEWPRLQTSWAKRLGQGIPRSLTYIVASAV